MEKLLKIFNENRTRFMKLIGVNVVWLALTLFYDFAGRQLIDVLLMTESMFTLGRVFMTGIELMLIIGSALYLVFKFTEIPNKAES